MKKSRLISKVVVGVFVLCSLMLFGEEKSAMGKNDVMPLPEPDLKGKMSVEEAINKRRSKRDYLGRGVEMEQLSQLLWAAQGITSEARGYRAAPSAGALYPLEVYLVKPDGVYHYLPEKHGMRRLSGDDARGNLSRAALGQPYIAEAPVDIVICAVYERVTVKYGKRGIRYTHMEAGHAAQNLHLQAVALGLGSVPVGAFNDDEVSKVLSLPGEHRPLYVIPVGYAR